MHDQQHVLDDGGELCLDCVKNYEHNLKEYGRRLRAELTEEEDNQVMFLMDEILNMMNGKELNIQQALMCSIAVASYCFHAVYHQEEGCSCGFNQDSH